MFEGIHKRQVCEYKKKVIIKNEDTVQYLINTTHFQI